MAKIQTAEPRAPLLPVLSLWVGSLGVCALAMLAAPAGAADRTVRAGACAHLGDGFRPIEGVDGCFRIGGHVRVEAGVMRGAGSLSRTSEGPAPAGFTGRLRAAPVPHTLSR